MAHGGGAGAGRSTATVLFTDLVGSTELRSRLGENAAEVVRHQHDTLVAGAVEASQGNLVKNLGDGIMATFTGASDAVGAAVAIQQAIGRHNRSSTAALEIRIGISAGDVVFEGDDCFGTPVIEAARLCGAAAGGQILASEMVRWLARSSAGIFTAIGSLELKGLSEPVPAVQVDWEPLPESSVPLPAFLTDIGRIFVGRDDELERLGQLWKEATAGELRVALLAGEPGVGKTRLAVELAGRVHDEGAAVLAGRCDEDLGVPYQPFVEALGHFVDHAPVLSGRLGRYGGELARLVPELNERLPGLPAPLRSDPETERYRLFDAVASWLGAASSDQPLLLLLDDLQWAAKPTLLLLRHLVAASELNRILMLGTYRDTELGHDHPLVEVLPDLRRRRGVERLLLRGLDSSGVAAFMREAAGHELEDEDILLARAIHEETEGNPFFVREVFRHLTETGAIERRGGRWSTRLTVQEVGIPEGVREVVGKRLARMSGQTNRVLRTAAVIGAEFEPVLAQAAGDFGEEDLICALEEATTARLVLESGAGRYRFAHALVRDTLYDGLSAVRRAAIHHRVAEALERLYGAGPGPRVGEIARHWLAATQPSATNRAIDYARWAGETALARLAPEEAVRWFSQGLELATEQPVFDEAAHAELLLGLGQAQLFAGEPTHRDTLLQAARFAEASGDSDRLARAALANTRGTHSSTGAVDAEKVEVLEAALRATTGDTAQRARLLATLAVELTFAEDWPRRRDLANQALTIARDVGDPATLVSVANLLYLAVAVPETLEDRLQTTAEIAGIAERLGDPAAYHFACRFRLYACADAGDIDGADTYLAAATETAKIAGEPSLNWVMAFVRSWRALLAGRVGEAEALATEAYRIGTDSGQPDAGPIYAGGLLEIRRHQNRLAEMEEPLARAVAENPGLPLLRVKLAGLYCELGRHGDARNLFEIDANNDFGGLPYDLTWLHSMTAYAEVSAALGDTASARRLYERLAPWHEQVAFIYYATGAR